jgi:hypothetical protein
MSFAPAVSYPVGFPPQKVETADFNHDGRPDLVTLSDSGSVSLLLGNGDGSFAAPREFPAGSNVQSLTIGDFDNDGNPDVATANVGIGVTALLGNGDGTFRPAVSTVMSNADPLVVAAALDLNGDGKSDLVAGGVYYDEWETRSSVVSVLYGNGAGGFNDVGWYNVGDDGTPEDIMVADLNRDGRADVVTTTYDFYLSGGHIVTVLLGSATGALNLEFPMQFDTGESPRSLAVGDFTGDGVPDVVTAGQTVEVLRGIGNGTFAPPVSNSAASPYLYAVAEADFNGDGKLDVVVGDSATGSAEVLLGRGDGTLSLASQHAVGSSLVVVGDFNADGRPDVATANFDSVCILLNDGAWGLIPPSLRIGDAQVTEGNSGTSYATFTVTLSNPYNEPVTVNFATLDGSATAGSDYQARSGTLTFAAGETTKTVSVAIFGDTVIENDEGFYLVLSDASANSNISDAWGGGSIRNDDSAFPPGKGRKKK